MSNFLITLLTFFAYAALALYFWRAQLLGTAEKAFRTLPGHAVAIPLVLHAWLLFDTLLIAGSLNLGVVFAISLICWLTLVIYWIARFFYPLASLLTLVLPLAALGVALPALFPNVYKLTEPTSWLFDAHVIAAMLAYSLFSIAALHAGLMSLVEKRLHRATVPAILVNLPPLLTMENLLFRIIGVGLTLLTLTLASGILFSEQIFGKPWQFNHKVLFGFVSWCVFTGLLLGHVFQGWRGRTAVRWTLSGFGFLILAYLGSKFVLEFILHR